MALNIKPQQFIYQKASLRNLPGNIINAYPNNGNCCVSSAIDRVCIVLCIILKTFLYGGKTNNFKNNWANNVLFQ